MQSLPFLNEGSRWHGFQLQKGFRAQTPGCGVDVLKHPTTSVINIKGYFPAPDQGQEYERFITPLLLIQKVKCPRKPMECSEAHPDSLSPPSWGLTWRACLCNKRLELPAELLFIHKMGPASQSQCPLQSRVWTRSNTYYPRSGKKEIMEK